MTEHNWAPVAPGDDDALMCTACCQCMCCETPTKECPGEWVPTEEDLDTRGFLDRWGGVTP